MFKRRNGAQKLLATMRRDLARREAAIETEIAAFQRELEGLPTKIHRQIAQMRQEHFEKAGLIEPTGQFGTSLRDTRLGLSQPGTQHVGATKPPRHIRAIRRRLRLKALLQFLLLASILAGCLLLAISMNAGDR